AEPVEQPAGREPILDERELREPTGLNHPAAKSLTEVVAEPFARDGGRWRRWWPAALGDAQQLMYGAGVLASPLAGLRRLVTLTLAISGQACLEGRLDWRGWNPVGSN